MQKTSGVWLEAVPDRERLARQTGGLEWLRPGTSNQEAIFGRLLVGNRHLWPHPASLRVCAGSRLASRDRDSQSLKPVGRPVLFAAEAPIISANIHRPLKNSSSVATGLFCRSPGRLCWTNHVI
jgi:hypothetical protein